MKKLLFIPFLFLFIYACNSNDEGTVVNTGDSFDRSVMLKNWADNIIIPSFQNYQNKVNAFKNDVDAFTASPNQLKLEAVRASWLQAYRAYQSVGMFGVGKATEIHFVSATNTYPTDTVGIEANISSGTYDFSAISQFSKQGFPALDFMLYGLAADDNALLDFYIGNVNASKYKDYLNNLVTRLKFNADLIVSHWNTTYRNEFVASSQNTPSSSTNLMVNTFVNYYERQIRAGKVGIPSGVFSTGTLFPTKTEAYYKNNISKLLLQDAVNASSDFFNGKHFAHNASGSSLKSYIEHLNVSKNGVSLVTIINDQFTACNSKIAVLNDSFSVELNANKLKMLETYDQLQKNVQYFKVDMMAALNISVDYADADGD
ncbi:imelysin family protein [Flavobacterium sp.]|uniref:imelysin family protein n=1 Tax=Flavobacterium sp. TaxID=239 RepID=UPI003D09F871